MNEKDFYQILGVSEGADAAEIKKAFRELAKKYHPDRHKGDREKEARFKEVSEAYETLSDEKKRAEYDNLRRFGGFRAGAGGPGGASYQDIFGSGGGFEDLSDLFGSIFGAGAESGGRARHEGRFHFGGPFGANFQGAPRKGPDSSADLTISFEESVQGVEKQLTLTDGGKPRTIKVRIPKGINDGEKIRLRGIGPHNPAGPPGDLLVRIHVRKHQKFSRDGLNILSSVTAPLRIAVLGGKVEVDTLTRKVMLTIPPGCQPGARLRLKGMGLSQNGATGDQIVEINVSIPTDLTEEQKRMFESLE